MSTLVISNIKATGETASRAVSGVAGAWINYETTSPTSIEDSANVSSVTDNTTGSTTITFSNSFSDYRYCVATFIRKDNDLNNGVETLSALDSTAKAASSMTLLNRWTNPSAGTNGYFDSDECGAQFLGDLA